MRHSTLFVASALGLFGCSLAANYQNIKGYENDVPPCISKCLQPVFFYYDNTCNHGTDMKCVCLIPEPDPTDPELAEVTNAFSCTNNCSSADQAAYNRANDKLNSDCAPYIAQYGPISTASHGYYTSQLGTNLPTMMSTQPPSSHTPTGSFSSHKTSSPNHNSTVTPKNNSTATSTPTGNSTSSGASATTTQAGGRSSASPAASQSTNAGAWNPAFRWETTVGLPVVVSLVLAFGMAQLGGV